MKEGDERDKANMQDIQGFEAVVADEVMEDMTSAADAPVAPLGCGGDAPPDLEKDTDNEGDGEAQTARRIDEGDEVRRQFKRNRQSKKWRRRGKREDPA